MTMFRRSTLSALAIPLALTLAACGSDSTGGDAASLAGDPIAPIAAPDGQEWAFVASETAEGGFVIGNPDAPIKLVEYASHTCPACANIVKEGGAKLEAYVNTGVVSFELRNQVHNALDLTIAMLARCGGADAFHPLAKDAWSNIDSILAPAQTNGAALNAAMQAPEAQRYQAIAEAGGLLDFFAARGISRDQANQCLANTELATQIVQRSDEQSAALNVQGTPTFFINGVNLGSISFAELDRRLQEAGAR